MTFISKQGMESAQEGRRHRGRTRCTRSLYSQLANKPLPHHSPAPKWNNSHFSKTSDLKKSPHCHHWLHYNAKAILIATLSHLNKAFVSAFKILASFFHLF